MENIQVLNDGADEEDFKDLLEILKGFGKVEVLYDPNDPKDKDITADDVIGRYENFKNRQEKMDPEQRNAYKTLLKELENQGEEATPARQILQLALQLDEKGEFYKFIEVFGNGRIDDKNDIRLPGSN